MTMRPPGEDGPWLVRPVALCSQTVCCQPAPPNRLAPSTGLTRAATRTALSSGGGTRTRSARLMRPACSPYTTPRVVDVPGVDPG